MKNILILITLLFAIHANAKVIQSKGVDQSVDYVALESLGPWDDRNYQLTKADIAVLPVKDQYLSNVPIFYKIEFRKNNPQYKELYPRSLLQLFQINYGGLLVDGIWQKEGLGVGYHPEETFGISTPASVKAASSETPLETNVFGNEVSIECNPTNGNNCVAGSNGSGGQRMYWSDDAGVTWTLSQVNPSSCCDPAIDWSSDGNIVYQADLASNTAIRWSRSLDQGHTWEPMQNQTAGGRDKEMIHVDRSPTSPFQDNIYLAWHDGNIQKFTRSTDMGVTMEATTSFNSEPVGIGSDITTDTMGNVYYFYPSTAAGQGIRLLKSTDGGVSFSAGTQVSTLNDTFDFPIPSMESRNAFVYTSADVDDNNNSIYVAWTDQTDQSTNSGAANNHAWINVAKSTDAGATWNMCPHPHPTADELTVDRFHPWVKVGENGTVHIGYYDTRHSSNRTGVDFYYTASTDGCATWQTEERYTTETSVNISNGQEWGDYNGLSVVLDKIAASFTDNRPSIGQTAMIAAATNAFAEPSFSIASNPASFDTCTGDTSSSTIDVASLLAFTNPVTLSIPTVPTAVINQSFTVNPVTPTGTSTLNFDVTGASASSFIMTVQGEASDGVGGMITKTADLAITYSTSAPAMPVQTLPANGAPLVPNASVLFNWNAVPMASSYILEIATDVAFANIIHTETVTSNSATIEGVLNSNTQYFWSVRGSNACAGGPNSFIFEFTTAPLPGDCPAGKSAIEVISYDFESGAQGWTSGTNQGADTWTISTNNPSPGGSIQHWHVDDQDTESDTFLTSPIISLPVDKAPLSFQFNNYQEMEDNNGTACWDGGILEISVNAGAFVQVDNSLLGTDPYDGAFSGGPLQGSQGWCGDPQAYLNSIVDINAQAGDDVQFRFRVSTDGSVGKPGWDIDDIVVQGCEANSNPEILVSKTAVLTTDGGHIGEADEGDVITFNVSVQNTGDVDLDTLVVNDTMGGVLTCAPLVLTPGAVATCTDYTYTVLASDVIVGGTIDNTADATMTNPVDAMTYMSSATTQTAINQALFKDGFE